jgi:hypothetical protein
MKTIEAPARSSTGTTPESKPAAKKIVAIIGAESAAGLGLVRAILEDPKNEFAPRAIVRSLGSLESRQLRKLGTELSVADPRDESALTRALGGAYGAFYIQLSSEHPSPETKLATAHTVARAAKEVGLHHVIWATLEDPGQTFLEHNDVTPTFQNGRWMSEGEGQKRPEQIFTEMEIPTTFLHTAWEATVAAGKWTEDIGKHAYGLLRDRDSIGQTVSISAARMIRRPTPAPVPMPATKSEPVTVPSLATLSSTATTTTSSSAVRAFAVPEILPPVEPASTKSASEPAKSRKIAVIGMVVAGALVGMVVVRQVQNRKVVPAPDPVESPRAAEAVRPPPVAVREPEAPAVVPPAVTAPPAVAAPPPVAASPEAPPPPAEVAPPEEMVVATHEHAAGKHNAAGKNHKRLALKAGAVAPASPTPQPAASAAVAPVKTEAPPKIEAPPKTEAPPERAAAPAESSAPAVAVAHAPAPKPPVSAPAAPPPIQHSPAAPQPGFVDPKAVNLIVRSHADEANACYERAVMEHPDLHGRLTIHAVIDSNGRVASVSPTSGITDGARLQSCLVRAFKSWVFPRPAGGVNGNVTYSFAFE